jgi:serine/threonine protein kinase
MGGKLRQRGDRLRRAAVAQGSARKFAAHSSLLENADLLMADLDQGVEDDSSYLFPHGLGPDDSGEVRIDPLSARSGSAGSWGSASFSSVAVTQSGGAWDSAGVSSEDLDLLAEVEFGRFQIRELLGHGQHALVYRAHDPILERQVALKVPRRSAIGTPKVVARFLAEAKMLARLHHPFIVPVFEAGCVGGRHFIAMGLIEGRCLADQLAAGPLDVRRAVEIVAGLAEALAYAHDRGVVHRDVKPANVRLDDQGIAHLMDFGIAYHCDSGEIPLPPGILLGTPAYVAPEQARGGQGQVLAASDQYSLGVVFYELLCGSTPFNGPPSYVLFHTIHHEPPALHTIAPGIPRPLATICAKALAKSPDDRYENCHELAQDLRRWLRGETPRVHQRSRLRSRS